MRKTRFERDLSGEMGEFWQKDALEKIADIEHDYETGHLIIEDGTARWDTNGAYLMSDLIEVLMHSKLASLIDVEKQTEVRNRQNDEKIQAYKERMKNHVYSEEELYEMRCAFGEGTTIVDVFTGKEITL